MYERPMKRKRTNSPRRTNFFRLACKEEASVRERLDRVPIEQDDAFLKAIKAELLSMMNRVRSETKQKLELLKQLRVLKEKESQVQVREKRSISVQCNIQGSTTFKE